MKHASFASISDSLQHDASAAWAYLKPVLNYILELVPDLEVILIKSNGLLNQYKNKKFLYLFRDRCQKLKVNKATQNYNGHGHGKGLNAEGAIVNRECNSTVLRGTDIFCAQDMIQVMRQKEDLKIKVFKIEKEDIKRIENLLLKNLQPIQKISSAFYKTWLKSKPNVINL